MRSRVTTYVLIAAVLAVWGVVAWKLFFSSPDLPAVVTAKPTERPQQKPEDDFLLLNYADPFLKNTEPAVEVLTEQISKPSHSKPAKSLAKPPIKYAGTIKKGGKVTHIFEHAGTLHSMAPGDEFEGYVLAETYADSVRMTKNGDDFIILTQQ
jgi:hypothetical protein